MHKGKNRDGAPITLKHRRSWLISPIFMLPINWSLSPPPLNDLIDKYFLNGTIAVKSNPLSPLRIVHKEIILILVLNIALVLLLLFYHLIFNVKYNVNENTNHSSFVFRHLFHEVDGFSLSFQLLIMRCTLFSSDLLISAILDVWFYLMCPNNFNLLHDYRTHLLTFDAIKWKHAFILYNYLTWLWSTSNHNFGLIFYGCFGCKW